MDGEKAKKKKNYSLSSMHANYNIESIVLLFPDSLCEMVKVVEIGAVYSIVTCVMLFHTKLKKYSPRHPYLDGLRSQKNRIVIESELL